MCIINLLAIEACLKVTVSRFYFSHSKNPIIRLTNMRNKCVKVSIHQWGGERGYGVYNITASELQLQDRYHNNLFWFHKKPFGGVPRNIRFLKKCSKFTGQHSCRSVISIKLQSSFIESTLRY